VAEEVAALVAAEPSSAEFASALAVSGDTLLIGAP
jgi:hypothetical protein